MENQQEQMSLFEAQFDKPKLPRHIRLIEIFAGIGAQAKGLEIIGADFEHWRTCEWSWQSIKAYNAIHIHETASTEHLSYEEVLDRLEGVSNDYNKPMTRKQCEMIWKPIYDGYRRIGYRLKQDEQLKLF